MRSLERGKDLQMRRRFSTRLLVAFAFIISLSIASGTAYADMRATYRNAAGATIVVEVAADGDARIDFSGQPFFLIVRDGVSYIAYRPPATPFVARSGDLQTLIQERSGPLSYPLADQMPLVERGTFEVAGHVGRAFWLNIPEPQSRPVFVLSTDSTLAPLRLPLVEQMDFSINSVRMTGGEVAPAMLQMRRELNAGAPLLVAGYFLEGITNDRIDSARLELPSQPVSIDQLRAGIPSR